MKCILFIILWTLYQIKWKCHCGCLLLSSAQTLLIEHWLWKTDWSEICEKVMTITLSLVTMSDPDLCHLLFMGTAQVKLSTEIWPKWELLSLMLLPSSPKQGRKQMPRMSTWTRDDLIQLWPPILINAKSLKSLKGISSNLAQMSTWTKR